jgi:hypothetical protein
MRWCLVTWWISEARIKKKINEATARLIQNCDWSTDVVGVVLNAGSWWELYFYSYHPYIGVPHPFFWYRVADTASFLSVHHVLHCRVYCWGILMSLPSFPPLEKTQGPYHRNGCSCISHCMVSSVSLENFETVTQSWKHYNIHILCVCMCQLDHDWFISVSITGMWMFIDQISS